MMMLATSSKMSAIWAMMGNRFITHHNKTNKLEHNYSGDGTLFTLKLQHLRQSTTKPTSTGGQGRAGGLVSLLHHVQRVYQLLADQWVHVVQNGRWV
jgi:hypothetical protein